MKHSIKITLILLGMFFLTQLIGLFVINQYSPQISAIIEPGGNITNVTDYNLPYGFEPPQQIQPKTTLISIVFAILIAVFLMFVLMHYRAEIVLRIWFFLVSVLAIGVTINSFIFRFVDYSSLIVLILAIPLAFFKIFRRNLIVHNLTELVIYPGIAAIFVPILNIWSIVLLLVFISIYDMYAVWHSGHMQKMAKYQIQKLKIFTGFFVPYLGKKEKELVRQMKASKSAKFKDKKIKVSLAILGGGDVVFPIIMAGVVLRSLGFFPALLISIGATLALAGLFYLSKKGKFYPAMPFISAGCFIALALAYLLF